MKNLANLLQEFVTLFNEEKFFESHELLEDYWRKSKGEIKNFSHGLIQLAVALHHRNNLNEKGAQQEYKLAKEKLSQFKRMFQGIYVRELLEDSEKFFKDTPFTEKEKFPKIKIGAMR